MKSVAEVHGAVSIVNAVATGKGSALGISLKVTAEVTLEDGSGIVFEPGENQDDKLVKAVVSRTMPKEMLERHAVKVRVNSEIPVGYGLKSSSSVSNAIALACLNLAKKEYSDLDVLNSAVDASLDAGVTITGAFDDACASYFGGFVVTDNYKRNVIRQEKAGDLYAIIFVPSKPRSENPLKLQALASFFNEAIQLAEDGRYWEAMTLNGLLVSSALAIDYKPVQEALEKGALSASVSGNGPALAATAYEWRLDEIVKSWQAHDGRVIVSKTSNEKARIIG